MLRLASLLLIPALVGACGVGAVRESTFVYGPMGPEGGTVGTEQVTLVVPPGALAGPTTIAIIPEIDPLPIEAPLRDLASCEYAVLGPQYCCGPVGLELLEDGRLSVTYDETLLPDDVEEDDLVLLLWDEALQALVPAGEAAAHDVEANLFVVDAYDVLGHLAVGVRTCPEAGIVFLGINPDDRSARANEQGDGATTADEPSGLWLVSADGSVAATQLPTGDVVPQSFLPSPDGETVLYELVDFQSEVYAPVLYGVGVQDGVPVLLAGDDEQIDTSGPTLGWMRDGSRVFFQEQVEGDPIDGEIGANVTSFSTVPGDGSANPTSLYPLGEYAYLEDVRQSLDGSLVMVAYYGMYEELEVDVFHSATGAPVSQGVIPFGGGQGSPRFLPDSSGLYGVDPDRETVERYDPDGTNPSTLFAPPPEHGSLKDFVLAPNGDDYAYVAFQYPVDAKPNEAAVPGSDALYLGSLSGGLREVVDLGMNTFYDELIFHPDGRHVFLDTWQTDVLMFAASDGAAGPDLCVSDISGLDISADDGRLLLVVRDPQQGITPSDRIDRTFTELPPGLYVADADGRNQQFVPTPADLDAFAARWLHTVRRAPCMGRSSCFR